MSVYKRDYYATLSLKTNCSPQDVKKSYRILALRWHPDKHNNQEEATSKFNEIHEAYSVLIDSSQREIYDKFGHQGIQKFRDNNNSFVQPNTYFTKGFQGTEKSAFETLWDILHEEEDNLPHQTDMSNNYDMNFFDVFQNDFEYDDDETHFINNYQPIFMKSEFLFPSHEHSSLFVSGISADKINTQQDIPLNYYPQQANRSNSDQNKSRVCMQFLAKSSGGLQQPNFVKQSSQNHTMKQKSTSIIIIDDESDDDNVYKNIDIDSRSSFQPNNSWINELNEFQHMLDQFHQDVEENLTTSNSINANSKKISKREKLIPSPRLAKNTNAERFDIESILTFS